MRTVLTRSRFSIAVPVVAGPVEEPVADIPPPLPEQPAGPNRKMRRRQSAFAARLARKLQTDGTPVVATTRPDGGLDIRVDTRNKP